MLGTPLFNLTKGAGAVTDSAVRLDGLSILPAGKAVLISIDGKPADWLELGATRDGVTLLDVKGSKAFLDTPVGFKEIGLASGPVTTAAPAAVTAPSRPADPHPLLTERRGRPR